MVKKRKHTIRGIRPVRAKYPNLQDAGVIINYDLHWNPVRLIQRAGVERQGCPPHGDLHFFRRARCPTPCPVDMAGHRMCRVRLAAAKGGASEVSAPRPNGGARVRRTRRVVTMKIVMKWPLSLPTRPWHSPLRRRRDSWSSRSNPATSHGGSPDRSPPLSSWDS